MLYLRKRITKIHPAFFHQRPRSGLQDGIFLAHQLLDKPTSLAELLNQCPAYARKLEMFVSPPNTEVRRLYLLREPFMENRLIQRTVPFNVPTLASLPALLRLIIGRVERVAVN